MSNVDDIDIETLRRSRWARLCPPLSEFFGQLTHFHWPKTKAEVTDCTPVRASTWAPIREDGWEQIGGYTVTFQYCVDGTRYNGITKSSFEVQKLDTFPIRYHPRRPEENNTVGSTNSRASLLVGLLVSMNERQV